MKKTFLIFFIPAIFLSASTWAGAGHDHGTPGDSAGGPLSEIVLTNAMIKNLGVQTASAIMADVAKTVNFNANIEYLPEKQVAISARTEGTVAEVFVKSGQKIATGDRLIKIQPRLVGNPPITLTAPLTGFVIEQNTVPGQAITPDSMLMRLADTSQVLVRGQAFENISQADIKTGQQVSVVTPSFKEQVFQGVIQGVDATLSADSRVRHIIALVDNPKEELLANMQATLSVQIGDQDKALLVPQRAILGELGNYFLYVREDDHFYRRDLILGQKFGLDQEIIEGVLPDEQVVIVGNYQLQFVTPPPKTAEKDDHGHDH